ncbi:uncharacterized protein MONBRDRAFT_33064 [Monosiga brevicollis MX1]|uniref:Phospholipid/glycerol acyltransferase domain-containing protein n=1 Tax=Monosiga brevicollis TaxID=81824 RepID=A9V3A9_MONBE|nr:uncharacterized protein MONBRDRAFT_33064 [Monosiga brevicollis MX1]EDQ88028.1 predicted protein [Monosiga brevicollis MX1]|eukprot:XP_001747104.1 hypothetical protein [Monosiga brevicollis MX1]
MAARAPRVGYVEKQRRRGLRSGRISVTSVAPPEPTLDPFRIDTAKAGSSDYFKLFVTGPILIPLRIILICIILLLANAWAFLLSIGATVDIHHPEKLATWRVKLALPVICFLARSILFVLGFYYIEVKGQPAPTKARREALSLPGTARFMLVNQSFVAPLAVCNHLSYFEPFALISLGYAHVSKSQVAAQWYWRLPMVFLQTLAVTREDRNSSSKAVNAIASHADRCLKGDLSMPLMIYPEGTTTCGNAICRFKTGAFRPGVPIQPVVLRLFYTHFNPSESFESELWFWRAFSQYAYHMKLEFLPVYYPTEEELDDHHLYADNVRRIMARKLNLHSADYSMYDVLLQYNARKLGLPPLLCSVEWGYFADNFDLRMEFANGAMEIFADMNTTKDALLTLNQLYAGTAWLQPPTLLVSWCLLKLGIKVDYEDVADLLADHEQALTFRQFLYLICDRQAPLDQIQIKPRASSIESKTR